jgi:hypothetical protein
MWTPSGLGRNMDPEQQVMQQQFTGPIPPYQFQQTTINRTPSTSNNKNNTQDEPEIRTNYTWQQAKKRKRCNQSPETTMEGNPFLFNTKNRYEELSRLSDEDMQTNETNETVTNTKNKPPRESKPHQYIVTCIARQRTSRRNTRTQQWNCECYFSLLGSEKRQ